MRSLNKRLINLEKHGIDFVRAREIWGGDVLIVQSPKGRSPDD